MRMIKNGVSKTWESNSAFTALGFFFSTAFNIKEKNF